jgi:hypothetical protein
MDSTAGTVLDQALSDLRRRIGQLVTSQLHIIETLNRVEGQTRVLLQEREKALIEQERKAP